VSDLVTELGGWAATRYPTPEDDSRSTTGRHAFNEDAVLTPIFHALTRGGWRSRQHEPAAQSLPSRPVADPVDEFRRDPLTAPIPVQALVPPPTPSWRRPAVGAHAVPEARQELAEQGRHHRRREPLRNRHALVR
jgi:hypothetical protein